VDAACPRIRPPSQTSKDSGPALTEARDACPPRPARPFLKQEQVHHAKIILPAENEPRGGCCLFR
jgi:hypothetical protein